MNRPIASAPDAGCSHLEWIKTPSRHHGPTTLTETLEKISCLRSLVVHEWSLAGVSLPKQHAYALQVDTSAHGVITRPFRSSGILSTLVLARSAQGFQARLQGKVRKLVDTMRSRRQLEKAIRVLSESQQLSETQAYEHMRARATTLRVTVAEVSAMIFEAHEAMEKLGLGRPSAKP
ncbi:ANTAR domain-containing response regulator [Variovorax sp. MHTC-1]|uniref:ANTAR domain-containing response regulator n=1 Tax=Variovorax sp. MHTC-1 TaxID=2495593 RepID=UPI0021AEE0ED|nr:ANTAR domain-containing protein [Variovorax sp. MHTC-1]